MAEQLGGGPPPPLLSSRDFTLDRYMIYHVFSGGGNWSRSRLPLHRLTHRRTDRAECLRGYYLWSPRRSRLDTRSHAGAFRETGTDQGPCLRRRPHGPENPPRRPQGGLSSAG